MLQVKFRDIRVGDFIVAYPNTLTGQITEDNINDFVIKDYNNFITRLSETTERQYDFYRTMASFIHE